MNVLVKILEEIATGKEDILASIPTDSDQELENGIQAIQDTLTVIETSKKVLNEVLCEYRQELKRRKMKAFWEQHPDLTPIQRGDKLSNGYTVNGIDTTNMIANIGWEEQVSTITVGESVFLYPENWPKTSIHQTIDLEDACRLRKEFLTKGS